MRRLWCSKSWARWTIMERDAPQATLSCEKAPSFTDGHTIGYDQTCWRRTRLIKYVSEKSWPDNFRKKRNWIKGTNQRQRYNIALLKDSTQSSHNSGRRSKSLENGKRATSSSCRKINTSACSSYRGITLLSIPGKVFHRVLLNSINDTVDLQIRDQQAGFRNDRLCTDQIATLRISIWNYHWIGTIPSVSASLTIGRRSIL